METIVLLVLVTGTIIVIGRIGRGSVTPAKLSKEAAAYTYQVKSTIMTEREIFFYSKLTNVAGSKYAIVPQAHLSMFLNHKVKGQNWKGAFSVINGKSVDYLLVDKATQKPSIAIELDDYTHQSSARIERDRRVEDIIHASGMRLVRFSNVNASEEQIFSRLAQTSTKY